MQVFEKMAAFGMAAILCFLAPAGLVIQRQDAVQEVAVMNVAATSIEQWKQRGYITDFSYDHVLSELAALGSYWLEMDYRQRVVEPDARTGAWVEGYLFVPQTEVEEVLEREGIFQMNRGDTLKIRICSVDDSEGVSMLRMLFGKTPTMGIQYGGIVTGELDEDSTFRE